MENTNMILLSTLNKQKFKVDSAFIQECDGREFYWGLCRLESQKYKLVFSWHAISSDALLDSMFIRVNPGNRLEFNHHVLEKLSPADFKTFSLDREDAEIFQIANKKTNQQMFLDLYNEDLTDDEEDLINERELQVIDEIINLEPLKNEWKVAVVKEIKKDIFD